MTAKRDSFTLSGRFRSGVFALQGIADLLRSQHNAWVHALATVCALTLAFVLGLNAIEWCFIVAAIVAVWVVEALNTAFEFLCDAVSPDFHPLVKKAKDIAAGAVLVCAVGAATIGTIIFLPHLLAWL